MIEAIVMLALALVAWGISIEKRLLNISNKLDRICNHINLKDEKKGGGK